MDVDTGLQQRISRMAMVAAFAACLEFSRSSEFFQTPVFHPWNEASTMFWPPSKQSAPMLMLLVTSFAILVKRTFFSNMETAECRRVREERRRLVHAQMVQALRWQEDDVIDEDEEGEASTDKPKQKKRPPPAADLFEIVFDDVEERHVTDYNYVVPGKVDEEAVEKFHNLYQDTLLLFKDRLAADFEDYVKFTNIARLEAQGIPVAVDSGLDNDDLKRVPEFADGTKLGDLLNLYHKKIRKAFGGNVLDKTLVQSASECQRLLAQEQRKGIQSLWPSLRPVLPIYGFAACLMIFDASNGTVVFHSTKSLLDQVGTGQVTLEHLGGVIFQTYIKFIFCVFAHLSSWAFTHKATAEFRLKVRNQIMANMMRQDMKFFDVYSSGILQERLNNDAEQLASKLFHLPIRLLDCLCRIVSCVWVLYGLDPQLFYVVVIPIPVIAVACHFIIRFMRKLGQRQRKIGEHVAANTMEVLKEIRTVREFAMEGEESDKFAANSTYRAQIEQYASGMHHIILISPLCCLFEGMRFYCTYLGGRFVAGGSMTAGQAVMAASLAADMTHMIRCIFDILPEVVTTLQPLGRVCDMLCMKPCIEPYPGQPTKKMPPRFHGEIEFKNVNFTFPSEPLKQVLFDLSWSCKPGEKVGFVGGTGCGKSTSLYLLERWYQPQSGVILLDGEPIENYDVHHLRRHMSVVAQTTTLFSTTIRENILYGLPKGVRDTITDEIIEDVLRKANALKFVNDFPRKLETYVGERGVKLSGGQRQRLAIARAIIRKPTLILLDEATSALDSKSEVVVQQALDKMTLEHNDGCTLIIAHRLSTLRTCDKIIVMDKGSVKESGSHDQLMRIDVEKDASGGMRSGWYRDLYETQHGKNDHERKYQLVKKELSFLKWEMMQLKEDNVNMSSRAHTIKNFKLGRAKRSAGQILGESNQCQDLPVLELTRCCTGEAPRDDIENCPPLLELDRARTTFDW